jgi:hypothetical protein
MSFLSSIFKKQDSDSRVVQDDEPEIITRIEDGDNLTDITNDQQTNTLETPPEISEDLFVEYALPAGSNQIQTRNTLTTNKMDNSEKKEVQYDLQYLYNFLERDFQQDGYNDALANPDMTSMAEKVKLMRSQLEITLAKVNTYYNSVLRNINFHIESRSRNGMVDIVDELISKKANIEEEMSKVRVIEQGAKEESGISETLIMSYKLGFKNGYAAISHSQLI